MPDKPTKYVEWLAEKVDDSSNVVIVFQDQKHGPMARVSTQLYTC